MKPSDQFHKWVEWSDEDKTYIGRCPDLITGIHGDDPTQLYAELEQLVAEVIEDLQANKKTIPKPRTRPMQEVA